MSAASRRKGLTGEREVAAAFEKAGWTMRGLEGGGDWLGFHPSGAKVHLESKRYKDRARYPEWWQQASSEAPPGIPAVLCTRADRGEWLVTLRLADLLDVIA